MNYQPRLKKEFNERIISSLKEEYSYSNVMMVPKLQKIVISKGVGGAVADKKLIDHAIEELSTISRGSHRNSKCFSLITSRNHATIVI